MMLAGDSVGGHSFRSVIGLCIEVQRKWSDAKCAVMLPLHCGDPPHYLRPGSAILLASVAIVPWHVSTLLASS